MVELQIVFIIISTLLGLLALIYKNTKNTKFNSINYAIFSLSLIRPNEW